MALYELQIKRVKKIIKNFCEGLIPELTKTEEEHIS